ncbi:SIS domain-containing protein [Ancylobacter sp. Lp-2]|uniref:SIS domain-containing protein n=1 Tax=Ancylobacter sp. Lp-2 TaxID=2881339 RepID=UPI001E3767A7|nr:SIS domain-containing protein [Ancylobacter sp. Lp-2]MCB4767041.1 SIS domain-containing protein [Ancylobacter sp. Lp-2]
MTKSFNLDTQIASAPEAVRAILATEVPRLDPDRPIIFTGIGTSLHAARVAASWVNVLNGGKNRAQALDAHDVGTWLPIRADDQVVVISHRGNKIFPTASLNRARSAGASTIAIVGQAAPVQPADNTVRTCANETAGTFTVSYLSSLAVLARLASQFDTSADQAFATAVDALPEAVAQTIALGNPAIAAEKVKAAETLLIIGFGIDLPTAQEAALKIKEGAWQWTEAMPPEFALHGTPASFHPGMAAAVIEPGEDDSGRTQLLLTVLDRLGIETVTVSERRDTELAFVTPHPLLRPVTGIVPLQRLTAELARLRDTDPDTMHGNREPWRSVMTSVKL